MTKSTPARIAHVLGTARVSCPDLRGTAFAQLVITERIGQGCRCRAFAARGYGRELILKVYHSWSAARHAHRFGGSIARYEYERNAAFRSVAALSGFSAAPIGFVSSPRIELFLQERVFGEPLPAFMRTCSTTIRDRLLDELRIVLECAHGAGLFDLDLHPSNIIVTRRADGSARPMLFDFNKVPYHLSPPNAVVGWLVRLGLIGRQSRDYRYWQRLARLGTSVRENT